MISPRFMGYIAGNWQGITSPAKPNITLNTFMFYSAKLAIQPQRFSLPYQCTFSFSPQDS